MSFPQREISLNIVPLVSRVFFPLEFDIRVIVTGLAIISSYYVKGEVVV